MADNHTKVHARILGCLAAGAELLRITEGLRQHTGDHSTAPSVGGTSVTVSSRTVEKLKELGYIKGLPGGKGYGITDEGRAQLDSWIESAGALIAAAESGIEGSDLAREVAVHGYWVAGGQPQDGVQRARSVLSVTDFGGSNG